MKSKCVLFIAAIAISGFWHHAAAQNEPPPAPASPSFPLHRPIHAEATAEAWVAFRSGDNETAIAKADQCINRFGDAADKVQSILETNQVNLPKGAVSPADQKRIAEFQVLHDVATCALIKGWAEEKLGHQKESREAYARAQKYTYARVQDSAGEPFWSPAEKASERLTKP